MIVFEERASDSPYIDSVINGHMACGGVTMRPASCQWHMVVLKHQGAAQLIVTGPLTSAGELAYVDGPELIWIRFRLGTFMPRFPTHTLLNRETALPGATDRSFWLDGRAWQYPDVSDVESFVDRLVRQGILVHDPLVDRVLDQQRHDLSARTVRHRFLRATGMAQSQLEQFERAQRAAALLRQGVSILDTVFIAGYFDQPHLTRALRRWLGYTPSQIARDARHPVTTKSSA